MDSPGTQDGTVRPVGARLPRPSRSRVPGHTAVAGLVGVLLALTAFSVTAAVTNADTAAKAERGVSVSQWSAEAERSLLREEDLGERLAGGDDRLRAEYDDARDATRRALVQLGAVPRTDHARRVAGWLLLHEEYGMAMEGQIAAARLDPTVIDEYHVQHVHHHHEELGRAVREEAAEHRDDARRALDAMADTQQVLMVATPVVFGLGLVLVAWSTVVLARTRRETVEQAERNRQQALHDALTGLPNRTLLRQRADEALAGPTASALLLIDLDRFKEINDTLGHAYGDLVLQAVAARLRTAVRATDTVARLGGDEFAILLPAAGGADAAADLAHRALAALEPPVDAGGVLLDVDASIGIALSGVHGSDVDTLLQNADIAMYSAKDRSLGVCVYDDGLNEHSPERLGLLGELRRALDEGELVLHYQPKVAVAGGRVCGVEALVRWQHPERGLIAPSAFVPAAERTPLIRPLTRYVLDAAVAQCARWRASGRELPVAVNVSARNLLDERFVDDVTAVLARWQVPATCLELEVTESAITADPERARHILGRLGAVGVTLSIDDFGAGYTSLAHLKDLPVHQLKIDRSFVSGMAADGSNALIVRSVVELGHNLGLTAVAEGVEDEATWRWLAELGCDVGQGYHLGRPLPADLLADRLDRALPTVPA